MYGVSGLNLDEIIGSEIQQICLGRYDVQFRFRSGTNIAVQSDVTLLDGDKQIATWSEAENWSSLSFQQVFNVKVSSYSVHDDRVLQIEFENGLILRLHDSSDQYESFQITRERGEIIVM